MATDATSSPRPGYGTEPRLQRPDGFWTTVVGSIDAVLRSWHGIHEFTDDPDCVFRVAVARAQYDILLSDGTQIRGGDPIGALHFWNEHLRRYTGNGPDLAWAADMRRRVLHSLRLLASHVAREPAWQEVRAFHADATLSRRLGDTQMRRLAERYGFEQVDPPASIEHELRRIGDSFNAFALTLAFNPHALLHQPFLRGRHELWITRDVLLRVYGRPRARPAAEKQPPRQAS
jgi:hypothetical protein